MGLVKFGDLVKEVKINIDRNNNPYEYYVAGDHMDSEDLTIRRKGFFATDDVGPAFTRLFKPGQILYGSRRTYLKKVAVADFEGICSNTTFVLETKDESKLRQRLLPFIMLTEDFTRWSISKSKGSTNPYILFSDLANYEFDLPDIQHQDELVELLWQAYATKESYKEMIHATDEMVKSQFIEMFGTPSCSIYPVKKLSEVCSFKSGTTFSPDVELCCGDYMYAKVADMNIAGNETYITHTSKYVDKNVAKNTWLPKGAVVFPKRGAAIHTNKKRILLEDTCVDLNTIGVIPGSTIDSFYLFWFFKCLNLSDICEDSGVPQINNKNLVPVDFVVPPMRVQLLFSAVAKQADKSKFAGLKSQFIEMSKHGCSKRQLGSLFCSIRNGANIKQGVKSGGFPITRIETIAEGYVDRSKMGYAGIEDNSYSGYYLQNYDILMSHINSMKHIGKTAIYRQSIGETVIHGMNLLCLRLKEGVANPMYVLYLLQSDDIRTEIRLISKQAVNQASFTVSDLKTIEITLPSMSVQNQFEVVVNQADKSKYLS